MLSQVERDAVSPSISSLRRIAMVLNVPAFYFLIEDRDLDSSIVRRDQRKTLRLPGYQATYQLLTPDLNKRIETILFELAPGEATVDSPMGHEGEESLVVIAGRLRMTFPDREVILEQGDSIYIEPFLPHRAENIGDVPASAICAISPPSF
jgi:mannose-6-phosphate isomerase-like protein (cupin superfamily)